MYMMNHVYDKDVIIISCKDFENDQGNNEDEPRKFGRDEIHG